MTYISVNGTEFAPIKRKPPKTGFYLALCGDGQIRKVVYFEDNATTGVWRDEKGFTIPDTWGGIKGWKPK